MTAAIDSFRREKCAQEIGPIRGQMAFGWAHFPAVATPLATGVRCADSGNPRVNPPAARVPHLVACCDSESLRLSIRTCPEAQRFREPNVVRMQRATAHRDWPRSRTSPSGSSDA